MEFKAFPKIERLNKAFMHITQKIHGTNAQVFIYPDEAGTLQLLCGSRTRWITPEDDNYGFARHVYAHKDEFISKLGVGQHFGEWAGLGINSGEGLTEKVFVLFDFYKYPPERLLPPNTVVVPVLYKGGLDLSKVEECMADLKANGSKLSPGFMRPEGVVVMAFGMRYKKVFDSEETKWKSGDELAKKQKEDEANAAMIQFGHLLQPIRLEKLLSRDERYTRDFPKSMVSIVDDYFQDLLTEGEITEEGLKQARPGLGGLIFKFVRNTVEKATG